MRSLSKTEMKSVSGGMLSVPTAEETGGSYEATNDPSIYSGAWEAPGLPDGRNVEGGAGSTSSATSAAQQQQVPASTITVIGRRGNDVTIRTNFPMRIGVSLPFFVGGGGRYSGTIPRGATFSGPDKNRNNIPDALESAYSKGNFRFYNPAPSGGGGGRPIRPVMPHN